jgi:hypothetical protein
VRGRRPAGYAASYRPANYTELGQKTADIDFQLFGSLSSLRKDLLRGFLKFQLFKRLALNGQNLT